MVTTTTPPRTPLYAMSDEQLLFIAEDDMGMAERRMLAAEILDARIATQAGEVSTSLVKRISEPAAV